MASSRMQSKVSGRLMKLAPVLAQSKAPKSDILDLTFSSHDLH